MVPETPTEASSSEVLYSILDLSVCMLEFGHFHHRIVLSSGLGIGLLGCFWKFVVILVFGFWDEFDCYDLLCSCIVYWMIWKSKFDIIASEL